MKYLRDGVIAAGTNGEPVPTGEERHMRRGFIFAAGSFYGLRERPGTGDIVIAADAGLLHCREAGVTPDVVLGDFDSLDAPLESGIEVCRLPVEKDDTDTLAAVRTALAQDCGEIYLYGGTGGRRLDHTLANLQTLLFIRRQGKRGWMYGENFLWTVIENEAMVLKKTADWALFSAFCLGDRAEGVDEEGFQYPLRNAVLTPDFPLGVSNHMMEEEVRIRVRQGALAIGWELPPLCKR